MRRSVVLIGNFDGVHLGHQSLIDRARAHATALTDDEGPLPVLAVTFWPHPTKIFNPGHTPKLLCPLPERLDLLTSNGVDEVRVVQFTEEISGWSPQQFIETILMPLNPAAIVVGENFRFGKKAAGTPQDLREYSAGLSDGFDVDEVALAEIEHRVASSSAIREALQAGDVETAAVNLGRYFRVRGVVVVGDQRGRLLGFPTANLPISSEYEVPADGVYAGWVRVLDDPDVKMPAAISVGSNPTFDGVLNRRVESYVLDRDDLELYGKWIAVDFVAQLRGMIKFSSVDELVKQMNKDVEKTRELLAPSA